MEIAACVIVLEMIAQSCAKNYSAFVARVKSYQQFVIGRFPHFHML
jgi:hypothetical protein